MDILGDDMGFREDSIAIAISVGNGYFRGNVCPKNADAFTVVESLGSDDHGMFEYPVCGWCEHLRASEIAQKDSDE
ncbi:hypothetical protein [Rhodococcus sp. OK302]|uniref:hypothetical protein n=1 Tax=Rhodococcus sp. OK302 TaxID=1882769 RepID=UPI000B943434|nr:hypothetical protein [Rhodococcus sp. OK302]OYD60887.1 hypothetical protein BDB13_5783 [Rhodococcus sp. OK302]